MKTTKLSGYLVLLLALGLLVLLLGPALAQSNDPVPSPTCNCGGGGGGGGDGSDCGGRPVPSVELFTGNLTITDMPVSYDSPGGGLPFVVNYSAQATANTVMGPQWTHSYNLYYIDNMPTSITFMDGNNRAITYQWDALNRYFLKPMNMGCSCGASQSSDGGGGTNTSVSTGYAPLPKADLFDLPPMGLKPPAQRSQVYVVSKSETAPKLRFRLN